MPPRALLPAAALARLAEAICDNWRLNKLVGGNVRAAFAVQAWAAIAPGLLSQEQWLQWAEAPVCPVGDAAVDLSHVPPMARRRLGHLAKLAISVADQALACAQRPDIPVVWASRYGDAEKALSLLKSQSMDEPLSPTSFGLSVHNAVGAQHSILRGMRVNAVCVASSRCAPEAGVVEAVSLLQDMDPDVAEVLLVCYDQPLPGDYAAFHDEPVAEYAWAALLGPARAGGDNFLLRASAAPTPAGGAVAEAPRLPHGLDVLHFLLQAKRPSWAHAHPTGRWVWERTHA